MGQPCTSSGSIAVTAGASVIPTNAATSQLKSGTVSAVILTPAAAASSCQLYDGTSTSGILIASLTAVANGASTIWAIGDEGVAYANSLFIVVAGTAATAMVHYKQG